MNEKNTQSPKIIFSKKYQRIVYGILFILVMTAGLNFIQNSSKIWLISGSTGAIEIIKNTDEVPLNEWLTNYTNNNYKKIELINETDLKGYLFLSWEKENFFGKEHEIQYFQVNKTTKSALTSLSDLGISLTGENTVAISYKTESIWMPKWPNNMLGIKIGKENKQNESDTKFSDIAGMEEVKNELIEIVDFLKDPEKYLRIWARPPKWVLLYGVPGGGKTLLARAVAGEAGVAFFSASGSEFMEMLVGMGASKVRKLFEQAKSAGKAIIFIDEIDAIGKRRGSGYTWGHQEQEQTLNQILTEMDGFDKNTKSGKVW